MQSTQFIWRNGSIVPWQDAKEHVMAHGLHYGSGVFEGIRFYNTASGPAIFKLAEHVQRLYYSAKQLAMKIPYSEAEICQAIVDIVEANEIQQGYIRPLVYYGYGSMKVVPEENLPVATIIACWPWGHYLPQKLVDIKTSPYIRIHPKSTVADAKIAGHYVNSILAGLAIRNTHYHEVLLLDADGYVAEASASNIFIVKDGKLMTPTAGTILVGITRNTVIEIANYCGIPVEERKLTRQDIMQADEVFICGTAVEITAVRSLDDEIITTGETGFLTKKIQAIYQDIVHGRSPDFQRHLTRIMSAEEMVV